MPHRWVLRRHLDYPGTTALAGISAVLVTGKPNQEPVADTPSRALRWRGCGSSACVYTGGPPIGRALSPQGRTQETTPRDSHAPCQRHHELWRYPPRRATTYELVADPSAGGGLIN